MRNSTIKKRSHARGARVLFFFALHCLCITTTHTRHFRLPDADGNLCLYVRDARRGFFRFQTTFLFLYFSPARVRHARVEVGKAVGEGWGGVTNSNEYGSVPRRR